MNREEAIKTLEFLVTLQIHLSIKDEMRDNGRQGETSKTLEEAWEYVKENLK